MYIEKQKQTKNSWILDKNFVDLFKFIKNKFFWSLVFKILIIQEMVMDDQIFVSISF